MKFSRPLAIGVAAAGAFLLFATKKTSPTSTLNPPPPAPSGGPSGVPPLHTPLSDDAAHAVLTSAFFAVSGSSPTTNELAMLMAQSAFETKRWASMYHWNFGNVIVTKAGTPFFMVGKNPRHFRVYADAAEGATAFVSLLKRVYPAAFALLDGADPTAYATALSKNGKGYFGEESVPAYAGGMARYLRDFLGSGAPQA